MRRILLVVLTMVAAVALVACQPSASTTKQQQKIQSGTMDRADAAVPIPHNNNFIAREMVAEYMKRMDQPNKTFYIYVMGDNGNVIGYYVSQGPTVNICTFMSPTDKVVGNSSGGYAVRQAPALDGLYYGSGACGTDYFFDAVTGALVQLQGFKTFVVDQPLNLEAEPISIKTSE